MTGAAKQRVLAVIAAGRRIAASGDPLGQQARRRLPVTSGLSPEGVELALREHLETQPGSDELGQLLATAGRAPRCHVVLAANVCTAPLRALACAAATAPIVLLKPSRRDPVLCELLSAALPADVGVSLVQNVNPSPGDELHLYGADRTIEKIVQPLGAGIQVRAHGAGLGVALVERGENTAAAAAAIAADLVPFDGRGCLSPRVVVVNGSAAALADALHGRLCRLAERVPRGELTGDDQASLARYLRTYEAVGGLFSSADHAVVYDPRPQALVLPPPLRATLVASCDAARLPALIGPLTRFVATIGSLCDGPLLEALARYCPKARRSRIGQMQKPPLDGPVDQRTEAYTTARRQ